MRSNLEQFLEFSHFGIIAGVGWSKSIVAVGCWEYCSVIVACYCSSSNSHFEANYSLGYCDWYFVQRTVGGWQS